MAALQQDRIGHLGRDYPPLLSRSLIVADEAEPFGPERSHVDLYNLVGNTTVIEFAYKNTYIIHILHPK